MEKLGQTSATLGQWIEAYGKVPFISVADPIIVEKISASAVDFDDWLKVNGCALNQASPLAKTSLEKLAGLAATLEQWKEVYRLSCKAGNEALTRQAMAKLGEFLD